MKKFSSLFAFGLLLLASAGGGEEIFSNQDSRLEISGYIQELVMHSEDFFGQSFDLSDLRFRLSFDADFGSGVSAEFSQSLEGKSGSALQNPVYRMSQNLEPQTYFDLEAELEEQDDHRLDWSVYRAWIKYENDRLNLTLGRQRIAFGTAYFFSPLDIFNPVSPLALEPEERLGIDGASLELALNENTYLTFAYGMGEIVDESKFAVYFKTTVQSWDLHLLGARLWEDWVSGAGFSGYLKEGSLYGEMSYTWPEIGEDFFRATVGYQYSFKNSLILTTEYFYNEGNLSEEMLSADPSVLILNQNPLMTLNQNFFCLSLGKELSPLLQLNLAGIYEIDHGSFFIGPGFTYSVTANFTLSGGSQFFSGDEHGDFGRMPTLLWIKARLDL